MNNTGSEGSKQQDHEIAQSKSIFVRHCRQPIDTQRTRTNEFDDQHKNREQEHFTYQQSSERNETPFTDIYARNSRTNTIRNSLTARNKRKNFNPRPRTLDANSIMNATIPCSNFNSSTMLRNNIIESPTSSKPISPLSASTVIPTTASLSDRCYFSKSLDLITVSHLTQHHPWLEIFNNYEQLVKTAALKDHHQYQEMRTSTVSNCRQIGTAPAPAPAFISNFTSAIQMLEWADKFGKSESTATAIRDILKAIKGKSEWDILHHQHQDGNVSVNIPAETEPPTPPTTPQTTCHSSSRSVLANGITDPVPHKPPACENSQIEQGTQSSSSSSPQPPRSNVEYANCSKNNRWNTFSDQTKIDEEVGEDDYHVRSTSDQCYHNEGLDNERCKGEIPDPHTSIREWSKDFREADKSIKIKIHNTEMIADDDGDGCIENNIYDEEDYPPRSPNDFSDSLNAFDDDDDDNDDEEDDNEDTYSLNMFCDDEQSEADGQQNQHHSNEEVGIKYSAEGNSNVTSTLVDLSNPDLDSDLNESTNLAEKDSTCSNSSSKISVRNLGGFYEQTQVNLNTSQLASGIDERSMHPDLVQNMKKFSSYLECLNEMCRLENLREHYHCHDYPCFGKILSKKEEVIRHVKWHRKRMESLNHGFMRFSSSDDCSATFGVHCQHNQKQTHYHCFQPNCNRVYISTSDVQMHSNFHRKDSAIHKEGFQRFRANEKCNANYCMFAGQKTTHFHCRRDNCRYTFKNKADMEKHKTYHIKYLKLARDGFKKFLKNEACPYEQCKFSKVCNHIHCARENCFYVLHSSGQLLSHKRKHERIDNEQTYCRYKMLAVKAALMGNQSFAAASGSFSADMPAFYSRNSLMEFKGLESDSINSKSISESSNFLLTPKKTPIFRNIDDESPDVSTSVMSIEFLQKMKKRHEEIFDKKTLQNKADIFNKTGSSPEVAMFPIIKKNSSPTHYDIAQQPSHLTSSVIEQFFTSKCPALVAKKSPAKDDQPLHIKYITDKGKECPWKEHSEPHLHCIIKGCEALTSNNIQDISAHIRMHDYNRDVYAATIEAIPNLTARSSNPMQITTIDGFFNRKRGRPPKNRFVEVYKNAQQSPQAIFTSFKLEKQTAGKDNLRPISTSEQQLSFNNSASLIGQHEKQQKEKPSSHQDLPFSPLPTSSQFVVYNQNENCSVADACCPLTMQQHYHCASEPDCTFVTMERDLLRSHLERQHTATSYADTISKKFKRFDRNIGLDCGILDCRLRKTRPHLHCRKCYLQISPFDLESHICCVTTTQQQAPLQGSSEKTTSASSTFSETDFSKKEQQSSSYVAGGKNILKDSSRLPSVTFSELKELRRKVSELEPECGSSGFKQSHEDDKVLVVRAAGTYFPENTSDHSKILTSVQQRTPGTTESLLTPPIISSNATYCSTPYCKKSRRPNDHCDTCDQSFVDPVKWRAHRLKHLQADNQPIPFHLSHFVEPEETNPTSHSKILNSYNDEQPQDLSLSPNTTITPGETIDERIKLYGEYFPSSTAAPLPPQVNPTPGHLLKYFSQDLMSSVSLQNFHLAQLATLYQQNPYYYQHLYPFLNNTVALNRQQQQNRPAAQIYHIAGNENKAMQLPSPTESIKSQPSTSVMSGLHSGSSHHFPFLNQLMVRPSIKQPQSKTSQIIPSSGGLTSPSASKFETAKAHKRKLENGNEELSTLIDALLPSIKKQPTPTTSNTTNSSQPGCLSAPTRSAHDQQHFKIRDEQIPNGYLKFQCNEDCLFQKCGYRNHQSHFHCDRNDCHYSFCDKTRFVQHTARHERLDKLMGNDFRQYRANMSCGYDNCPYYKNLGSANKSSHFHCFKCEFICSDTNKVVAHRRQHNKMEYIRMAGFRKVGSSEQCGSTIETIVPANGNEIPETVECSYSRKRTHYHCLVCDVSVLTKAQLSSHKHKT